MSDENSYETVLKEAFLRLQHVLKPAISPDYFGQIELVICVSNGVVTLMRERSERTHGRGKERPGGSTILHKMPKMPPG